MSQDAYSLKEDAEEILQMYANLDTGVEAELAELWEFLPNMLVGIMRSWWFETRVSPDRFAPPFYPDRAEDVRHCAFAQKFCQAMIQRSPEDQDRAYRLARNFVSDADFFELLPAMKKIAGLVLEVRGE